MTIYTFPKGAELANIGPSLFSNKLIRKRPENYLLGFVEGFLRWRT